jgi:spermidine/putrescine transport system substrate-binding protein
LLAAASAAGACVSKERQLNVYNWENYVARDTIPAFEREFHCRVRYASYGSAEEMLAKVMSGNSGWDVVFPSNSYVPPMRELGLLAPLNHKQLSNLPNLHRDFQKPDWDAQLARCVPYMFSGTGIAYSKKAAKSPTTWADLWTDTYRGRLTMMDDQAEVFGACLKRMGRSVNSTDFASLQSARDLAIQQKPLLRAYLNEEVRDQVVAGDVLAAQMWAQVAQVAIDNSPDVGFSFPAEGFSLYADNVAILRESSHQELAHEFINYLLRPKVAALICKEMRTATANGAARAILPESDRRNTVLYPLPEVMARGEWFRALTGNAQQLRDRLWTEVKTA